MSTSAAAKKVVPGAFKLPLVRTAGPHKLPHLLSLLPNDGQHAIVKPSNCPYPDRVFLVTRRSLKYTSVAPKPQEEEPVQTKKAAGSKVAAVETPKKVEMIPASPVEGGTLRPHGKVWAMEFKMGRFHYKQRNKLPDCLIRNGLTDRWISVDPASLDEKTRAAVENWEEAYKQHMETREQDMAQKAEAARERREKRKAEKALIKKNIQEHQEEMRKVKILY